MKIQIKLNNSSLAIIMMITHSLSLSFYYITIELISKKIHPIQSSFLYTLIILICIIISCFRSGFKNNLQTKFLKYHIIRGLMSSFATIFLFFSIQIIGVSCATALSKLEHCIMIVMGILIFNEKINKHKIVLFIGNVTAIIFLIDFEKINHSMKIGYIYMVASLIFWVLNNISIKKLTMTEKSRSQLFYSSLFAVIVNTIIIVAVQIIPNNMKKEMTCGWYNISPKVCLLILFLAFTKFLHKLMFFKAYKLSDLSVVSPFDYSRLIFTSILAFLFFNRIPNTKEIIGYTIIIVTGIYFIIYNKTEKR